MSDGRSSKLAARNTRVSPLTELAALLLAPAAAVGFVRIFENVGDATPVVLAAVASSLLAIGLRYARVPLLIAGPLSLIVLAVGLLNLLAPGTTSFLVLPTDETREALQVVADQAIEQFRSQRAPVDAIDGFVAAAAVGAWISAFIVDWAAIRLRLAFEPVLPAGLLFIFTAVVGSGEYRLISTAVFASAVILWTVAHRASAERQHLWLTADRRSGPNRLATGAAMFGFAAVATGLIAGPLLPGAGDPELLDWRNNGDPTRRVISPFVNIGSRLVNQTDTELFRVQSERPSYYRLAGLDTYAIDDNGIAQWLAQGQESSDEDGSLPGRRPTAGTSQSVEQTFTIQNLGGDWLPAAFAPTNITSDLTVSWIAETGSLIVDEEQGMTEDLEYTVESLVPLYTSEELRSATTDGTNSIRERYLGLPDDLSPVVADQAQQITAGAATDYDRLILLQSHFRTYDYSVRLSKREGDPTEQFLRERIGFCQQFSGTFALMARTLGIPTRVAVGFTWGQPVDGEPDVWQITGRHTHAWPEAYFDDLGWVAFEPTPQRGSPSATDYTTVEAQQDEPTQPDNPFGSTTTTTPIDPSTDPGSQQTIPFEDPDFGGGTGGPTSGGGSGSSIGVGWVIAALAIPVLLFGLPALQRLRRTRRRQRAGTPAERVDNAWAEAAEALEHYRGEVRPDSETRIAFCERLLKQPQFSALPLGGLATAATASRYAPATVSEHHADTAEATSDEIVAALRQHEGTVSKWWHDADPRRLIRPTVRVTVR